MSVIPLENRCFHLNKNLSPSSFCFGVMLESDKSIPSGNFISSSDISISVCWFTFTRVLLLPVIKNSHFEAPLLHAVHIMESLV